MLHLCGLRCGINDVWAWGKVQSQCDYKGTVNGVSTGTRINVIQGYMLNGVSTGTRINVITRVHAEWC